jgi:hypothetical protein
LSGQIAAKDEFLRETGRRGHSQPYHKLECCLARDIGERAVRVASKKCRKRSIRPPISGTAIIRNPTASPKSLKKAPSVCQWPETKLPMETPRCLTASQIKRTTNHSSSRTVK